MHLNYQLQIGKYVIKKKHAKKIKIKKLQNILFAIRRKKTKSHKYEFYNVFRLVLVLTGQIFASDMAKFL